MSELFEITLHHRPQLAEIVIGALLDADLNSFEEGDGWLRWFSPSKPDLSTLRAELTRRLPGEDLQFTICQIEDPNDWQERWKENWSAIEISPRLAVSPAWVEYSPAEGQQVVVLETTSAFGTGTHETTHLCLELLDQQCSGKRLLDIGCGSGVLSIAAEKLGAAAVFGIDIDPLAVETARQNALRNQCQRLEFSAMPLASVEGSYDLIVANILSSVIKTLWPDIRRLLKPGGKMILSGILAEEVEELQRDLGLEGKIHLRNEWAAIVA